MASKLTTDEKIQRLRENIAKEEQIIAASREKIKNYNAELKALTAKKEMSFATDLIGFMKQYGISQEQVKDILKAQAEAKAASTVSSPSATEGDDDVAPISSDSSSQE